MTFKKRISEDKKAMGKATLALLIVGVLLVTGVAYAGYSFYSDDKDKKDEVKVVEEGDRVECDYIGAFTDGRVFDTSLLDVAHDNVNYPKALQFSLRADHGYVPYSFTVGSGTTIEGWQDAVMGMSVGQTKVVRIEPAKAYGESNPDLILKGSLTVDVPLYSTLDLMVFQEQFYGVAPTVGGSFYHPAWKWYCEVTDVQKESGTITFKNMPDLNGIYTIYEKVNWQVRITNIDQTAGIGGKITVKHLLSNEDANNIMIQEADGSQFIVTEVNEEAGTYTMDYNREVVGKTLVFKITITDIVKAG
ncbi:MAG TPA: FKBP-type peptidyl-prolyl cis-trans isomerase [Euryarchaeota archaeon]|nr:FKBP-type peptidyl-prolyl cis-trans isomerase [Euryarchaeota archaeon]